MDNLSKMTIDDSSTSMYFSFNSTTAFKIQMENANDNSMAEVESMVEDEEEYDQNNTLEAGQPLEDLQTIKKLSSNVSAAKAIPKNILKAYNALASTPTKAQLFRSVDVSRGSAAVDVGDLGLAFLEAPQESINAVLPEDKENQPQEIYSEISSEMIVSVIEKTREEEKPMKRVGFSNLPVLTSSRNSNIRAGTPEVRRSISRHEPDLAKSHPPRNTTKRISNASNNLITDCRSDEIPRMLGSILKISKGLPLNRKCSTIKDNPFNLLGKATRMSIVKTTLNSPARKVSRKSVSSNQLGQNSMRLSNPQINKDKGIDVSSNPAAELRRSVIPRNYRKSILPTTITSPKKRIVSLNSRRSVIFPKTLSWIQESKSMPFKPSTSTSDPKKKQASLMKLQSGPKEDFFCAICSRKFLLLSLFEAHKRTHNVSSSSRKQIFSSGNDYKCRYCDKKFAIAKALENHLIQNCTKIPPGDKKKLLFQPNAAQSKTNLPPKSESNVYSCILPSSNHTQLSRNKATMASQLSNNKLKKKLAHSGVYCTPNKQVICHICKSSFNNILAFTEHKISHSNTMTIDIGTESKLTQSEVECNGTRAQQK